MTKLVFLLGAAALACAGAGPDPSTLEGKVLLGYQGWFNCAGDGAPQNSWRSWARGAPAAETLTIDMYPDLTEFAPADLCALPGFTIRGRPAYVFSAWNPKIVDRHFRWMKDYGLDGVLVQRFVTNIAARRSGGDVVLRNVMAAARRHGRVFAIEYDVTGSPEASFPDTMREDWKYLVEELQVTAHPGYLRHNGRPVLSVWGMGLEDPRHPPRNPGAARKVVAWFKSEAPPALRVTYMGGVPSRWRTLTADAQRDSGWNEVYAMMDVIQPWTVGRYRDEAGADRWRKEQVEPDLARTRENRQMYMPVIFPGFSWANLKKDAKPNQIPRNGGSFLWRQAYNARQAGASLLKIAMFDEVNEGTAVFKIAPTRADAPEQGFWLTLDADGRKLPGDWYLRLSGLITKAFRQKRELPAAVPRP
ncbi:MAG: glycoside hydrolase family 71/99-like protein [Bryobacteraceae bacterium]